MLQLVVWLACVAGAAARTALMVTGDVNLNPALAAGSNFSFVWGDLLPVLAAPGTLLAINHESTLAGIVDKNPATIHACVRLEAPVSQALTGVRQFEDPLHYVDTYRAARVAFVGQANNHQYDYGLQGMANTVSTLMQQPFAWGGLGATPAQVRTPVVVTAVRSNFGHPSNSDSCPWQDDGSRVAFFTMVVDECWVWPNGTLYLDACTCGTNAGVKPYYQCYAAGTPGIATGLWYQWGITDAFITEATSVVGAWKKANPDVTVVAYLHVGANFQWQPYPQHERLLRSLAEVCDLVWGTSSHHIQRFEVYAGTPVIYGLGDLLFRHVPGVDDFCPLYAVPCAQYRPELSVTYRFDIGSGGRLDLSSIRAYPSIHSSNQTARATDSHDLKWMQDTLNELSCPGACFSYNATLGAFTVAIAQ